MERHRNLFCVHYDSCLNVSVRAGWESWTCARCPLRDFAGQPPSARDYAQRRTDPTII